MQDRWIPEFADQGFVAAAVHCLAPGTEADTLAIMSAMTYPMAYDFDREFFRFYRRPRGVFPLNVVVDREGHIAYVGEDFGEAENAVRRALDRRHEVATNRPELGDRRSPGQ